MIERLTKDTQIKVCEVSTFVWRGWNDDEIQLFVDELEERCIAKFKDLRVTTYILCNEDNAYNDNDADKMDKLLNEMDPELYCRYYKEDDSMTFHFDEQIVIKDDGRFETWGEFKELFNKYKWIYISNKDVNEFVAPGNQQWMYQYHRLLRENDFEDSKNKSRLEGFIYIDPDVTDKEIEALENKQDDYWNTIEVVTDYETKREILCIADTGYFSKENVVELYRDTLEPVKYDEGDE